MKKSNWIRDTWRPAVGVTYIAICIFDFILFPIAWTLLMAFQGTTIQQTSAWIPITLGSGGLFHLSFGAILGVYAWGRSKEKIDRGWESGGSSSTHRESHIDPHRESNDSEGENSEYHNPRIS